MAYTGTNNLNQLDVGRPLDTEQGSVLGAALREAKLVFKTVLLKKHNPDGSLIPLVSAELSDDAVITAKIADLAVTGAKIADSTLRVDSLIDLSITGGKLADDIIIDRHVADGAILTAALADLAVTNAKLAGSISGDKILSDATVDANRAITGDHIKDGTIPSRAIASLDLAKLNGAQDAYILVGSGTNWTAVALSGDATIDNLGRLTLSAVERVATFGDAKAPGQDGGAAPATTWFTRDLAPFNDPTPLMSWAGNAFSLPAGTYQIWAACPGYDDSRHQARLFVNKPDGSDDVLVMGSSVKNGNSACSNSIISGIFTVGADDWSMEIQHWFEKNTAKNLGTAVSSSPKSTGPTVYYPAHKEIYTNGWVRRLS